MSTGYYFIYDTCPDLYDKMITSQLKKDKTPFTIAEIFSPAEHTQACNEINVTKRTYPKVRKIKACESCYYAPAERRGLGRKKSDKLTMISILEETAS